MSIQKVKSMNSNQKAPLITDRINKSEFLSYSFQEFPKPQRLCEKAIFVLNQTSEYLLRFLLKHFMQHLFKTFLMAGL